MRGLEENLRRLAVQRTKEVERVTSRRKVAKAKKAKRRYRKSAILKRIDVAIRQEEKELAEELLAAQKREKEGKAFYARWRRNCPKPQQKILPRAIKQNGKACSRCGSQFRLSPHHLKPRSEGGADHSSNLITLCVHCHDWAEEANPPYREMVLWTMGRWEYQWITPKSCPQLWWLVYKGCLRGDIRCERDVFIP